MFKVKIKDNSLKVREVELEQAQDGVVIKINNLIVAKFDDNDDRIIIIGGITKEQTGLDTYDGHATVVWVEDAETSRQDDAR